MFDFISPLFSLHLFHPALYYRILPKPRIPNITSNLFFDNQHFPIFFTFLILKNSTKVPAAMSSDIPMLESKAENQSANIETDRSEIYPPGSYVVSSRKNEFVSLSPKDMKLISAYGANVQLLLKDCDNVVISRWEL